MTGSIRASLVVLWGVQGMQLLVPTKSRPHIMGSQVSCFQFIKLKEPFLENRLLFGFTYNPEIVSTYREFIRNGCKWKSFGILVSNPKTHQEPFYYESSPNSL